MTSSDHQPEDDSVLVSRCRHGDREAFASLYDRYARLIRAVAYDGVSNSATAQDITQETFLRAWSKLDRLRDPTRFVAWLVGIARQVCREQYHATCQSRRLLLKHDPADATPATIVEQGIITLEHTQMILDEIAKLPDRERLAIHAFYLNEHDVQYVASLLKMSRSGVYVVLQRACRTLASRLRPLAPEKEAKT
jgi:RNA polymerase sigma-70 factor (ECF subfamily)